MGSPTPEKEMERLLVPAVSCVFSVSVGVCVCVWVAGWVSAFSIYLLCICLFPLHKMLSSRGNASAQRKKEGKE